MSTRLSDTFQGADLGKAAIPQNHPWSLPFDFGSTDVSAYTWLGHARLNPASEEPDAVFTVTPAGDFAIVISLTTEQVQGFPAGKAVYCSLDQVTPTDREMFRWQLVIVQDATH